MGDDANPREIICELCRDFFQQGWVSGTGGGMSIRSEGRIYMAPSGVQKERLRPSDIFVLDEAGQVIEAPPAGGKVSACAPLFLNAFRLRGAGAVIHSHSVHAVLATLLFDDAFRVTHLEMMKGVTGVGYHDQLVVPIIENTAHEHDLAEAMAEAIEAFPRSHAVLVRRHGVYVWGDDWAKAKTHAECYDYLFDAAVRMRHMGLDPARHPEGSATDEKPRVTH